MRNMLTTFVALTVMSTAASADPSAPRRLTDNALDSITAGLNIDTPFLAVQTNCGSCSMGKQTGDPGKFSHASSGVYNLLDDPADGKLVASYAGPLRIIGAGLATGTGSVAGANPMYANVVADAGAGAGGSGDDIFSFTRGAYAYGLTGDGTVGAVAYNGPLGIMQAAGVVVESESPYFGAVTDNPSLLSINGLGGVLVLPTGGGRQAAIEGRLSIGAPGL